MVYTYEGTSKCLQGIGLMIELVRPAPFGALVDKRHAVKIVRDMARVAGLHEMPLYAVITDFNRLEVIKCVSKEGRDSIPLCLQRFVEVEGKNNVRSVLTSFLRAHPADLGVHPEKLSFAFEGFEGGRVTIAERLGKGAHGQVWAVAEKPTWVVKRFTDSAAATAEKQALTTMHGVAGVPTVVASSPCCLLMEPRGTDLRDALSKKEGEHYKSLLWTVIAATVGTLQEAHSKSLVHRDVRATNIVIAGLPILIDWASACHARVCLPYSGTTHFASVAVLRQCADSAEGVTVGPEDDLESLVFTIAAQVNIDLFTELSRIRRDVPARIADFWEWTIARWSALCALVTLARGAQYGELLKEDTWRTLWLPKVYAITPRGVHE